MRASLSLNIFCERARCVLSIVPIRLSVAPDVRFSRLLFLCLELSGLLLIRSLIEFFLTLVMDSRDEFLLSLVLELSVLTSALDFRLEFLSDTRSLRLFLSCMFASLDRLRMLRIDLVVSVLDCLFWFVSASLVEVSLFLLLLIRFAIEFRFSCLVCLFISRAVELSVLVSPGDFLFLIELAIELLFSSLVCLWIVLLSLAVELFESVSSADFRFLIKPAIELDSLRLDERKFRLLVISVVCD